MKLYNDPLRGIVYNPNWPVEPEYCDDNWQDKPCPLMAHPGENFCVCSMLNSALQTAIGEAIPFEDQKVARGWIINEEKDWGGGHPYTPEIKPGTFYEVPDLKLELDEKTDCQAIKDIHCRIFDGCNCKTKSYYRIVSEPKQEPKGETQEENKAVIDFAVWYSGMDRQKVVTAYQRYEREVLTRKKLNP